MRTEHGFIVHQRLHSQGGMRPASNIVRDPSLDVQASVSVIAELLFSYKRFALQGTPGGFTGGVVPTLAHIAHGWGTC